jgi:translation elongation factor EF-1alpha
MSEQQIGVIHHWFDKIGVAAIIITGGTLTVGDTIHIMGATTDITTIIESMQIEHGSVDKVKKGDAVGVQVAEKVREHDMVFKVTD